MNKKIILIAIIVSVVILITVVFSSQSIPPKLFDKTQELDPVDFEFIDKPLTPLLVNVTNLYENDEQFKQATQILQGLNITNIEDDLYWQSILNSFQIINEKSGRNGTMSLEDSQILRDLLREKIQLSSEDVSLPIDMSSLDNNTAIVSDWTTGKCDSSYPDFCLPSSPDLDCSEIPIKNSVYFANIDHLQC